MSINFIEVLDDDTPESNTLNQMLDDLELAKSQSNVSISVVGVGGGGCNAVTNIHASGLKGVKYIAVNTDTQALRKTPADKHIQLGVDGQGAGAIPAVAKKYAEEKFDEFKTLFTNTDMVFITAGLGKGTGTGATGTIVKAAKEAGALTVCVVTKPFDYEGPINKRVADQTSDMLAQECDALITVMNSKLEEIYPDALMDEWYKSADEVLISAVGTIVEVIHTSGYQNVDFKDVLNVMGSNRGRAMMGTGRASGDNRAQKAAYQAMNCQLLEENSITSARGVLVNITASRAKFRGRETSEVMNTIRNSCADDVNPIMGLTFKEEMGDDLQVTLIVSGLGSRDKVVAVPSSMQSAQLVQVPQIAAQLATGTHDAVAYTTTQAYAPLIASPQTHNYMAGAHNIPTLTQAVQLDAQSPHAKQYDVTDADAMSMLYPHTQAAGMPLDAVANTLSQAEKLAAEVASFQHKGVARQEPNLLVKPMFGHLNRSDLGRSSTTLSDQGVPDLDVPTFLRKPLAD